MGCVVMVSIGGYTLKNVSMFNSREGCGFEAKLYKGSKFLAYVYDNGYGGGSSADFDTNLSKEERIKLEEMLKKDMTSLLDVFGNDIVSKSLAYDFANTPYSCATGFAELLLDLRSIEKLAKKCYKTAGETNLYCVSELDATWFAPNIESSGETMGYVLYTENLEEGSRQAIEMLSKKGKVLSLYLFSGKPNLKLSFEEYVEKHKKFLQ